MSYEVLLEFGVKRGRLASSWREIWINELLSVVRLYVRELYRYFLLGKSEVKHSKL